MKALSKDSSKEEEELDDMEMTDPFSDLQVGRGCETTSFQITLTPLKYLTLS